MQQEDPRLTEAQSWLEEHGDALFRFARRRVDSQETAEDLVQDTLVAAMKAHNTFQGKSSVRTWLTSILQKKIIDHIRRKAVERKGKEIKKQEEFDTKSFFANNGHWRQTIRAWPHPPSQTMENEEFWRVLDECSQKLTGPVAYAFRLRDLEQLSTEESCKILGISPTNLSVRLHRARLLLRECLEKNWFRQEKSD